MKSNAIGDLFADQTFVLPPVIPVSRKVIKKVEIPASEYLSAGEDDDEDVSTFTPVILAEAPAEVLAMPEDDEPQKFAKVKATLKWMMSKFRTAFSFSSGKDSSTVLGLAMTVARELVEAGQVVQPFVVLNADTLVENPQIVGVAKAELARVEAWIKRWKLPGTIHVATPTLTAQFAVAIIGGRSLPSTFETKRDCTTDWKAKPLNALRKSVLGKNDVASGDFVVTVTGVRFAESAERAGNMRKRGESPTRLVQTDAKGSVFCAPIAHLSYDDVVTYLGFAKNGKEETYSSMTDVISIYQEATGECMALGSDTASSKGCGARFGCWSCMMVSDDKSMTNLLSDDKNAYMKPLSDLRRFLANTFYDLSRRTWIGRSITDQDDMIGRQRRKAMKAEQEGKRFKPKPIVASGYITFGPDAYAPAMLQELLSYALTIDAREIEAADRLGIEPRFQIISPEALIAIDAMWSLHGFAKPFTALKIYTQVRDGARFDIPDVPEFPKADMPATRWIYVGNDWDQGMSFHFTGLRDALGEMVAFDAEVGGSGCMGTRQIESNGVLKTVMDVNTEKTFSVNRQSAIDVLLFEADRLVEQYHGANPECFGLEGVHFAANGYKYYARTGVISVTPGQVADVDRILKRTCFRERMKLAGYNYDHQAALEMSVDKPSFVTPEQLREAELAEVLAQRQAKRRALRGQGISLAELYRDWSPDIGWKRIIRSGALEGARIPAHCSRARWGEATKRLKARVTRLEKLETEASNTAIVVETSRLARKAWARWFRTDHYRLIAFLMTNPVVLEAVKKHRRTLRKSARKAPKIDRRQQDLLLAA